VPRGDPDDPSRDPALFDGIADFLSRCGVRALDAGQPDPVPPEPDAQRDLLSSEHRAHADAR